MKEISPETSCFICKNRHEDVRQLALQASKYPDVNMAEAVVQIAGWQIAEKKIPLWVADRRDTLSAAFVNGTMFIGSYCTI